MKQGSGYYYTKEERKLVEGKLPNFSNWGILISPPDDNGQSVRSHISPAMYNDIIKRTIK